MNLIFKHFGQLDLKGKSNKGVAETLEKPVMISEKGQSRLRQG